MTLYRPSYLVELDPNAEPVTVVVSSGDMLRAELEAKRLKVEGMPLHTTALWLWSALVRAELEDRRAGEFIAEPPEFEPVKREVAVDPTSPESGETDSGALLSSVTPDSGSIPT